MNVYLKLHSNILVNSTVWLLMTIHYYMQISCTIMKKSSISLIYMDKNSLCYILRCCRCCKSSLKAVFKQKTNHQYMGWAP